MNEKASHPNRRDFLKRASVSVPALVVVGTWVTGEAQAIVQNEERVILRDTPHTRAYFDSTRF